VSPWAESSEEWPVTARVTFFIVPAKGTWPVAANETPEENTATPRTPAAAALKPARLERCPAAAAGDVTR
jgi:hypothetical protein